MYKSVSAVLALLLAICGDAYATPGRGVVVINRFVSSAVAIDNLIVAGGNSGLVQLHQTIGNDRAPVNVVSATQIFAPGDFSGWHSHPGPGWVVVESGTATLEETEGCPVNYPAGSVFFESGPNDVHNLTNRSASDNLVIRVWFFQPVGIPGRIDQQPVTGPCSNSHPHHE